MNLNNKKVKIGLIICSILIILLVTVGSYAYFTISINGNNDAKNTVVTTGYMEVTFEDGQEVNANSLIPGNYIEKTFTVTNTGNVPTSYGIYFNEVVNSFANPDDLVYELISEDGTNVSETKCPLVDATIKNVVAIDVGQTHHYTLKITFKETGDNQDVNKGKVFKSIINIEKKYESVRRESKLLRTGYYNFNKSLDENYNSLGEFVNENPFFLKQDITRYYATVSDYAVYVATHTSNEITTIEACQEDLNNIPDLPGTIECVEQDGKIYEKYTSDPIDSIDECYSRYYEYNQETGEYVPYNDENSTGECIKKSGKPREVLINTTSENEKVCHSNNDSEVCFGKWMKYEHEDLFDESFKRYLNSKFQDLYNEINGQKKYKCRVSSETMECFSEDDQVVSFSGHNVMVSGLHHNSKYYLYNEKHTFDNLVECSEARDQAEHTSNCFLDNNEAYFYTYNYNYNNGKVVSESTLEACQDSHYYNDDDAICVQINYTATSITFPVCSISDSEAECREQTIR